MPKIVIMDDDVDFRSLLQEGLKGYGYDVEAVEDGRKGIEICRAGGVDLVVIDVLMPDMDGIEVLKAVKDENPKIKTIVVSGGGKIDAEQCLKIASKLGVDKTLRKPFDCETLFQAASDLLK